MRISQVLEDAFGRIRSTVEKVVDDLSLEELSARLDEGANSIAWLVWHLTRIQDDHLAAVTNEGQVWTQQGFYERFGLTFPPDATGYGQRSDEVDSVRVSGALLRDYHDAVYRRTVAFVRELDADELDRIVDDSYDPPVSLGVRLVSVITDGLQHAGQAAFVKGVLERGGLG